MTEIISKETNSNIINLKHINNIMDRLTELDTKIKIVESTGKNPNVITVLSLVRQPLLKNYSKNKGQS